MAAVAEESDIVRWGVVRAAMGVAVLALTSFDAALAQGRLDARYAVTLAGTSFTSDAAFCAVTMTVGNTTLGD